LCELAGLEKPFHLQGKSFVPLAENPNQPWKEEVFCRWIRGETVVTKTHTYTEWFSDQTEKVTARMMYDLTEDPEETVNISEKPENKKLVEELSAKMRRHIQERDGLVIP
jgi:arylsulfatase A-like enzyme